MSIRLLRSQKAMTARNYVQTSHGKEMACMLVKLEYRV